MAGNLKYRAGRLELLHATGGDLNGSAAFKCVLVGPGSSYLSEHPATVAGFTSLLPVTGSVDKAITSMTLVTDTVRDRIYLKANNPTWTGLTPADVIDGMVFYHGAGGSAVPWYGIGLGQPAIVPDTGEYEFPFNLDGISEL